MAEILDPTGTETHAGLRLSDDLLRMTLGRTIPWLTRLTCRATRDRCDRIPKNTLASAVGSIERCQLAIDLGLDGSSVCEEAAIDGNLPVVQWAYARYGCKTRALVQAASRGHLEVIRWLWSAGVRVETARGQDAALAAWDRVAYALLVAAGLVAGQAATTAYRGLWVEALGIGVVGAALCLVGVRRSERLATAADTPLARARSFTQSVGCGIDADICNAAAINGHLGVLEWAHEVGIRLGRSTFAYAALCGQVAVLEWALDNDLGIDLDECAQVASGRHNHAHGLVHGHVQAHVLEWLDDVRRGRARSAQHYPDPVPGMICLSTLTKTHRPGCGCFRDNIK